MAGQLFCQCPPRRWCPSLARQHAKRFVVAALNVAARHCMFCIWAGRCRCVPMMGLENSPRIRPGPPPEIRSPVPVRPFFPIGGFSFVSRLSPATSADPSTPGSGPTHVSSPQHFLRMQTWSVSLVDHTTCKAPGNQSTALQNCSHTTEEMIGSLFCSRCTSKSPARGSLFREMAYQKLLVCRATNSTAIEAIQTLLWFYATGRSAVMKLFRDRVRC